MNGCVASALYDRILMMRKFHFTICIAVAGLLLPISASAQSDSSDVPLGDIARNLRHKSVVAPAPAAHAVIDNDNLSQIVEEVEKQHHNGATLKFSFDAAARDFQVSSPDVTCSLSFNAQTTSLISDPFVARELPAGELTKLDGPAAISGDTLQVSVYNGSSWDLREITVGLTLLRKPNVSASGYGEAKLIPASSSASTPSLRQSDTTLLYQIKGAAAPAGRGIFRAPLGLALDADQEWHWAIVQARGIPPRSDSPTTP